MMSIDPTVIENIQRAALETIGDNIIPTELTYQQALSIHLRSEQLKAESATLVTNDRKSKQIDNCWNIKKGK